MNKGKKKDDSKKPVPRPGDVDHPVDPDDAVHEPQEPDHEIVEEEDPDDLPPYEPPEPGEGP
ncbi:MAG: hypothetical protein JNL59_08630 [Chitinophagaceae bacterium]|jgi:hypothetical protein|nr:hypothetical protein [Chitinophagaceae bacterium]